MGLCFIFTPGFSCIQFKANNNDKLVLTRDYYDDRLIVGYENISQINDSIYALNLNNGFLLLNANQNFTINKPIKPLIEKSILNIALKIIKTINYGFETAHISNCIFNVRN